MIREQEVGKVVGGLEVLGHACCFIAALSTLGLVRCVRERESRFTHMNASCHAQE